MTDRQERERGRRWIAAITALFVAVLGTAGWYVLSRGAGRASAVEVTDAQEAIGSTVPVDLTPASEIDVAESTEVSGGTATVHTEAAGANSVAAATNGSTTDRRERTSSSLVVTVTDEKGAATSGVLLRLNGESEEFGLTDETGSLRFQLPKRIEGELELEVLGTERGRIVRPRTTKLTPPHPAERRVSLTSTVWPPPVAGDVTGTLVSETGGWPGARFFDEPNTLILELVTHADWSPRAHEDPPPRVERRATLEPLALEDGSRVLAFKFEDVPEGAYELTLSALDSYSWSATSLFVEPPMNRIELVRFDASDTSTLGFRVVDAATNEPIEDFEAWKIEQSISATNGVFMHAGPFPTEAIPLSGPLRWSLHAEGYAPAFGDERAFDTEEEGGRIVATVRLVRGWGACLCVMGPQPSVSPMRDVQVAFGGTWQRGRTDDAGLLVVYADEMPTEVEFDVRGWKIQRGSLLPVESSSARRRGFVAPFVLVPD